MNGPTLCWGKQTNYERKWALCLGVHIIINLCFVIYDVEHSFIQDNQSPSVGDQVKQILVKAESWVATRDGPISKPLHVMSILVYPCDNKYYWWNST